MPSGTPSANLFTEFYCVDNNGVRIPATANDLAAVGASCTAPPPIKKEHRAAKLAEARAARDAAGEDAAGAGEDAMDVDVDRNPNGNRNLPSRRIHFD